MADKKSKLQPQNRDWYEDLPSPTTALKAGDSNDQPDPGLDVRYVDANVLELSRAESIERGFFDGLHCSIHCVRCHAAPALCQVI